MSVAIALGGGAPNLTLMTGALLALDDAGVEYKVITTTGAGMVAGLLYAAPRRESEDETWRQARRRSLKSTREMGIDDLIYNQFPVNYKIFQKPGKLAEAYAHAVNPTVWGIPRETRRQRLLGDTLGLFAAAMQPSSMSSNSQGLCQPPPWISLMVNFDELQSNLKKGDRAFALSAYCIEDKKERTFRKWEITEDHFKAGLAMPFLYAPYKLEDENGEVKTYLEGSAIRTMQFNPDDIMADKNIDTLIYFDLMGNRHLLAEPKNIIDAWGKSIVAPLTQLAYLQEQLVDLKRFSYSVMNSNMEIIANYDEMTGMIEDLMNNLKTGKDDKRNDLIAELKKIIADARSGRVDILNETETRLKGLNKSFAEDDSDGDDKKDAPSDDEKSLMPSWVMDIDENPNMTEAELQLQKRRKNWLRYAGFTLHELEKISSSGGETIHADLPRMLRMPFRDFIPEDRWDTVLDWSHSNMSSLFDIGYDTAQMFVQEHYEELGLKKKPKLKPLKYKPTKEVHASIGTS
ncbi:MAG: hypothetical protein ABJM29_12825 [Rhizobiaceae bacterium]